MERIAVIGLGKLGATMAALYATKHDVLGIDVNSELVLSLNNGDYFTPEPALLEILKNNKSRLTFVNDFSRVGECRFVLIVVPTPSGPDGAFVNDYIEKALEAILPNLTGEHTVVVCSTVMPGSCDGFKDKYIDPLKDISLVYSPEFIALGNIISGLQDPDLILIGAEDSAVRKEVLELQRSVLNPSSRPATPECTLVEAELAKLAINNYLSIKTAFANSIGELATSLGGDANAVMDAVGADARVGSKFLRPGMVACGPCIPRDTVALRKLSWDQNVPPFLSRSAEMIHDRRRAYLLTLAKDSDGPYAIVGLTYKPFTPVTDESPTVWLADRLIDQLPGETVWVWDPLSVPDHLKDHSSGDLQNALIGANTIILGDVSNELREQVISYYNEHDVRLVDCWRT